MESILELKPILLRMFNEMESLQANVKERDEKIRHLENTIEKLTKENEIYHKVVRMYEGITDDNQPAGQEQEQEQDDDTDLPIPLRPEAPTVDQSVEPSTQAEEKKVTVKQRRRKVRLEPEPEPQPQPQSQPTLDKAERMREYQRQYRQKRKEAKK
jgi:hypothetical protein